MGLINPDVKLPGWLGYSLARTLVLAHAWGPNRLPLMGTVRVSLRFTSIHPGFFSDAAGVTEMSDQGFEWSAEDF